MKEYFEERDGKMYRVVDHGMVPVGSKMMHGIDRFPVHTPDEQRRIEENAGRVLYNIALRQTLEAEGLDPKQFLD